MTQSRMRAVAFGLGSFVIIAFVFLWLTRSEGDLPAPRSESAGTVEKTVQIADSDVESPVQAALPSSSEPHVEKPEQSAPADPTVTYDTNPDDDEEPINWFNGMNPEDQPRAFHRLGFEGLRSYPPGYTVTGEEMRLSDGGWTLAPPTAGEEEAPRSSMVESPVFELDFPSNSITPIWKETSPEGTEVLVEVAASPDGRNWTSWYPTTGAHTAGAISRTDRHGKPNPNYGYTRGDMVFLGVGLYRYYKYNMMLYSEVENSPTVSDFALYYQDSTMGDGHIVEYTGNDATEGAGQ